MAAVAVLAALAAVALAVVTAWLLVDRRRTCARIDALTAGVDRAAHDLAVETDTGGEVDSARSDATDTAAATEEPDPAAAVRDAGPAAGLTRLARATDHLADLAGLAADLRARSLRALDAIPQGVVICDLTGSVIARNLEASCWVEARHGEALVQVAVDEMLAAAAAGRPELRTIELLGPPSRTVDLSAMPVVGGAVVVIDDVSERRRVDALRRDFVANISHEMRTPVGALSLLAETLLTETELLADQPSIAVVQRLAERLYHEALRLGRTIDDLLELSRIEAGEPPARDPVLVADVLAAAIDRTQPAAELRDVTLHVELPDPDATTWGDRRQLVSAVANLVDNAVKYSDPGGKRRDARRGRCLGHRPVRGARPRHRHPRSRPRPGLRALLPRRPGAAPRHRWHGARSRHRAPRGHQPRWRRRCQLARGRGLGLHPAPPARPAGAGPSARARPRPRACSGRRGRSRHR